MKMKHLILTIAAVLLAKALPAQEAKAAKPKLPPRVELVCPLKPDPPPVVDGDNRDWERVPSSIAVTKKNVVWGNHNWKDEDDLSGSVSLCYDQNYLYLLVEVVDDKIVVDEGKLFYTDHIEVSFVPRMKEGIEGVISKGNLYVFGFTPGSPEKTGDPVLDVEACGNLVVPPNEPWEGVEVEASFTEDGYILEARFPWKVFKIKPSDVKLGATFGIDVHLSDSDNGPTQETLTSLNHLRPWKGRRWEDIPKMVLTGTDGKKPAPKK